MHMCRHVNPFPLPSPNHSTVHGLGGPLKGAYFPPWVWGPPQFTYPSPIVPLHHIISHIIVSYVLIKKKR